MYSTVHGLFFPLFLCALTTPHGVNCAEEAASTPMDNYYDNPRGVSRSEEREAQKRIKRRDMFVHR
jgi:hypothetical protein